MKITKDEARILASALNDYKFREEEEDFIGFFDNLEKLEIKLEKFSRDKRRKDRGRQDDWLDTVRRFSVIKP